MVMANVNALKNTAVQDVISVMKDSMIFLTANVSLWYKHINVDYFFSLFGE